MTVNEQLAVLCAVSVAVQVALLDQMLNDLEPFTTLNPSAENIAKYFYDQTNGQLNGMTQGRVRVKDCTIWETDTTTATYYE